MKLTIFTPTYNRAYILAELFKSLQKQNSKNFEWLIVDDGSTDNTSDLVNNWIKNSPFKIKYIFQENQGKHIAINTALANASSDYFMTVDSDDRLLEDAIKTILEKHDLIKNKFEIAIIASCHRKKNSTVLQSNKPIPRDNMIMTSWERKNRYNIRGEFSYIIKTSVAKEFPYPAFPGEKFCRESLVYRRIEQKYKSLYINKPLVESEYLEDGLTSNIKKMINGSPKGIILSLKEAIKFAPSNKEKQHAINDYWKFIRNNKKYTFEEKARNIPLFKLILVILKNKINHLFS